MNSDRYVQYHNVHLVVCNDDDDCVYALMFVGVKNIFNEISHDIDILFG